MENRNIDIEKDLRELCVKMIGIFDDLKTKGRISEEEYQKHTRMKKEFLNNTLKQVK